MAGKARSAKNLWSLVSGTSVLKSTEIVGNELQDNAEWLLSGILYYKKAGSSSVSQLKDSHKASEITFIEKLHKILDVDVEQCSELFRSFVCYEYKGTQKNLESLVNNERHTETLLFELWNYYYSERLYCLLTLKHVLEHWQDKNDPYQELYDGFMKCFNENGAVMKKIISQLEASFASEVPSRDMHWTSMYDHLVRHWVTYVLREQSEILQLLLLYCKSVESNVDDLCHLFSMFQKQGFGTRQPFRQHITENNQPLIEAIGYLECLAIIECFHLDLLADVQEDGMDVNHFLQKDESAMKTLDTSVHSLGILKPHGPVMMAWMILNMKLNSSNMNDIRSLGNAALQLDVFEYLSKVSHSSVFSKNGVVTEALNSIIYTLLSLLLTEFELSSLVQVESIFNLVLSAVQFQVVAEDFWNKDLDYGAGILLKNCFDRFPIEFCTLLKFSSSLASSGKQSCKKVLKLIKNIETFCEWMEHVNMSDVMAINDGSALKLLRNKAIYGDENLIIPAGTLGTLLSETDKSQTIVQWRVNVNGWQVCLRELYVKLQELSVSLGAADSESLVRVIAIADLVHSLLKTDPETKESLKHIINLLFSILERASNHSNPPLDFIAKMFDIAAVLYQSKETNAWPSILKTNFLPFVIGFSQGIKELAGGTHVNMGKLGEMIASRECIFGKYPLCISFVKFIVTMSENLPDDNDNSYLACVLYIVREIFSCFHKWSYANHQEKLVIGQACLTLLHNLFTVEIEEEQKMIKLQQLCMFSLLYFEAGQTLLRIVCTGEDVIHQTILRQNSDFADCITGLIRLGLSVLNRLLLLRHQVVKPLKVALGDSPLEQILLSTPGQSEQPQVMLTVANYAFQHYNPRLATLAVQLLKRFAKEFPMSLLACFASEAEAIRDHFLLRLSSAYEDIRLKVSIIEFLTVCIAQQPGLIEMFINVNLKNAEKNSNEEQSCLTSVKNIVKENPKGQCEYFQELQCVAVEFIHALWAAYQGLAMNALKKDPDFWSYFCERLLAEDMEVTHPRFAAYVIRTLALEFFYHCTFMQSGTWNDGIKKVMEKIQEKNLISIWSKHVNNILPVGDTMNQTQKILDQTHLEDIPESFALYTAWRDFIIIIAKNESALHFDVPSEIKNVIMLDILNNIWQQMNNGSPRLLILLSEFYLMLFNFWGNELTLPMLDETFKVMQNILQYLAVNSDEVRPRIQLALVTAITHFVTHCSKVKDKTNVHFIEWVYSVCKLLKKSSVLVDQQLKNDEMSSVLKLPVAVICLLNKLIEESDNWLPVLKTHVTLPLLVSLLMKSLSVKSGARLALSIITVFATIASNKEAAEALCNTGFMAETILTLSVVNLEFDNTLEVDSKASKNKVTATNVYYAFLMLIRVLLQALGNYFLQDALNFVGVHMDHLHATLIHIIKNPLSPHLGDAVLTCTLIHHLSYHQSLWQLEHKKSFEVLLNDVSICSHVCIALLMRQNLMKHMLEQKEYPSRKVHVTNPESRATSQTGLPTVEVEAAPSERMVQIQTQLMKLLAVCLATLKHYSPGLHETLYSHQIDHGQWQLLLNTSFQTPSLDQESNLTFGALSNCVNMCLQWLGRNERTPSPSKSFEYLVQVERHLLLYVLEMSLNLLLSQCSLALTHPGLSLRDKQLIKREMAAELNAIVQSVNRYLRRGPVSPSDSMSSPRQPYTTDLPFMKFIDGLLARLVE